MVIEKTDKTNNTVIQHQSMLQKSTNILDQSAFVTSKLNLIDDLLQETFTKKQSLTEANKEYLDRYLEVF